MYRYTFAEHLLGIYWPRQRCNNKQDLMYLYTCFEFRDELMVQQTMKPKTNIMNHIVIKVLIMQSHGSGQDVFKVRQYKGAII